jgi:DNA-binding NarL/FixJ family response regulator
LTATPDVSRPVTAVIICDDVPELRELVRSALEADGDVRVIGEAAEGQSAVREVARLQPDVVVLDLAMPLLDGVEAIPLIRAAAPHTGIVVFSGLEEEKAAPTVLRLFAARYVQKGAPLADLVAAVREVGPHARPG